MLIITSWLVEPGGAILISQRLTMIPILRKTNSVSHIGFYYFKIHSNWSLFPVGLSVQILKALLPSSILAIRPVHSSYIIAILNYLGSCIQIHPAYVPPLMQETMFDSRNGNTIVLYILIFEFLKRNMKTNVFELNNNMKFLL